MSFYKYNIFFLFSVTTLARSTTRKNNRLKKLITYNQTQFCIHKIAANQFQANEFNSVFFFWLVIFYFYIYFFIILEKRHNECSDSVIFITTLFFLLCICVVMFSAVSKNKLIYKTTTSINLFNQIEFLLFADKAFH